MNGSKGRGKVLKNLLTRAARSNEFGIFVALIVLFTAVAIRNPSILKPYSLNLWIFSFSLFGIIAIGETLVVLTGGIDLSPGSLIALMGVLFALLVQMLGGGNGTDAIKGLGWSPWLAISAGVVIILCFGLLVGLFHAFYINKLAVPPFIITLGTLIVARGVAEMITHGPNISALPAAFGFIGASGNGPIPYLKVMPVAGIIFLSLAIAFTVLTQRTALGRQIYAVGGNFEGSRLSGVRVNYVRGWCYAISGLLSALAGVIYASNVVSGDPKSGYGFELTAIAALVIGGTSLSGGVGTILGSVIGAMIMGLIPLGLTFSGIESWWQSILTGIVVVIAVTLDSLRRMKRQRTR
ncbi:MAG: ABC transporter permease [Armatimonadota bacterium]